MAVMNMELVMAPADSAIHIRSQPMRRLVGLFGSNP